MKQRERKRLTELKRISNDKKITHCYIRKGSYYRPNSCGYTDMVNRAGIYTKQEALKHAEGCDEITLIPIDIVEHNDMIAGEIQELMSRYIKNEPSKK